MSEATETQDFDQALDNSLDAALGELQDTEAEDAALLATEDDSEDATDDEAQETPPEPAPAAQPKAEGKLPAFADAVQKIEEALGPEVAEVVRRTQSEGSRKTQQFNAYKAQVEQLIQEVQQLRESKPAEPDEDDQILQQLSQRDQRLMDAYLRKQGYVRQEEIAAKETTQRSSDYVRQETERAAQEFGERFAKKDGEQFVFDEEVQERMTEVMTRLEDDARGVTPADLFVLANWRQMVQEAEERGKATAVPKPNGAPKPNGKPEPPRSKGAVVARSTGGRPQSGLVYRRGKDHPVRDFDSVLDRALALSRQEMRERL